MAREWLRAVSLTPVFLMPFVPGQTSPNGYKPVTPASTLQKALESNLGFVRQWLKDKDYKSAAQSVEGVEALALLYYHRGTSPQWQKETKVLRDLCEQLASLVEKKNGAMAKELVKKCEAQVKIIARLPPPVAKPVAGFRPGSGTKTWMLLMDGAYSDARYATSPGELARYARELAEEANALAYLQQSAQWQKHAKAVSREAVAVSEMATTKNLTELKKAIQKVYQRCKACHENYRR